jgi:RNA polymerase sigma-70 factor (ECF subfamily)
MTLNIESDTILWNQFRDGDEASFVRLFKNYYSNLYHYGCKISRDTTLVEDCIQELFIEMWRSNGKAEIISLKAYIFKSFKFKLLKALGKIGKMSKLMADQNVDTFQLSHEIFLMNEQENNILTKKVQNALDQLSPRQKEIVYLKFYMDLSYEEVSEIMNINYQASRNLVYQSVKVLKNILTAQLILSLFAISFY